jgi:hypothetical protein
MRCDCRRFPVRIMLLLDGRSQANERIVRSTDDVKFNALIFLKGYQVA